MFGPSLQKNRSLNAKTRIFEVKHIIHSFMLEKETKNEEKVQRKKKEFIETFRRFLRQRSNSAQVTTLGQKTTF